MAFGLAMTLQDDKDRAHLFARRYDGTTTVSAISLQKHFEEFQARGKELGLI